MCQNSDININDMNEISSSTCNKKTVRFAVPRKIRKPLMERKRRARINLSLDELKRIVVEAEKLAGQDITCRVNKLEKADILEMTVKYLKRSVMPPTPNLGQMYLAGYKQCVEQLQDLLAEQWTDKGLQQTGQRMIEHLEARTQQLKVPRRYCSNDSSEPEDDEEESNNTTNNTNNTNNHTTNTTRPSHNHSTHVGENPPKSMWRPW